MNLTLNIDQSVLESAEIYAKHNQKSVSKLVEEYLLSISSKNRIDDNKCMDSNTETIIENINFSMTMEDMPLTEEDKIRLRNCLDKNVDINTILKETIKKHTLIEL